MLKLKNAIIRYTTKVSKSRRSSAVLQDPLDNDNGHYFNDNQVLQVDLDELTDIEKKQFILWWNGLNPFHLNELDNAKALDFLSKFELPENKLEQVILLKQRKR
jgi:hypothetical protein